MSQVALPGSNTTTSPGTSRCEATALHAPPALHLLCADRGAGPHTHSQNIQPHASMWKANITTAVGLKTFNHEMPTSHLPWIIDCDAPRRYSKVGGETGEEGGGEVGWEGF